MLHSCGTVSEYEPNFTGTEGGPLYCLKDAPFSKTTPNACSDIQATSINSDDADVLVIPKWVNCGDRSDLPDDQNLEVWKDSYGGREDEATAARSTFDGKPALILRWGFDGILMYCWLFSLLCTLVSLS